MKKLKILINVFYVLLLTDTAAHQDGLLQTHFKPLADQGVASSLRADVSQGVTRMRDYWLRIWPAAEASRQRKVEEENEAPVGLVKEVDEAEALPVNEAEVPAGRHSLVKEEETNKVPAGRQQMYFRPVSVTLQCVMVLTIVSALVYTFLSMSRNADELSATFTASTPTQMLTIGSRVSAFAPMLCMLFVGCRMYVLATTEGLGEPPAWVKSCMWTAVLGVVLQLIIVLVLPNVTKKQAAEEAAYDMTEGKKASWEAAHHDDTLPPTEAEVEADMEGGALQSVQEATGEQNDVHPDLHRIELRKDQAHLRTPFWLVQMLSMLCIYGSITGVIVGILTFPAQTTKVSPAVLCTIYLSMLYFGVSMLLWIARAISDADSPLTNAALCMTTTTRKAPMFAVLFLASRMRALQLDPPYGMPPPWMQSCFLGITALLYLEALFAAYVGLTGVKTKGYYGVYLFRCPNKGAHFAHHGCALVTYGLLMPVVYGVMEMQDASGIPAALSTTMKCVLNFEAVYFGVMLAQDLVMFAEEYEEIEMTMLRDTAISAGISLGLAPLLCILFVATRMRALQITQQQGDPPGWAQDCMVIAVFATCTQAACCLLMPIFIGSACKVDEDGNPDYDLAPMVGAYAVAVVKYVALIALHGSIIAICVAVFVMTPETANSSGRFITNSKHLFEMVAGVLVVFCIALLLSSAKVIGMAIKMVIESADQELIGVDITIKKVALNIFKGYVHISRLKVHQPEDEIVYKRGPDGKMVGTPTGKKCEWAEDYIAKVDLVLIKINLWRIATSMGKEFEFENLSIKGVHVNVEKPDTNVKAENANIQYIINYMDSIGLIPPPPTPEEEAANKAKAEADATAQQAQEDLKLDEQEGSKVESAVASADGKKPADPDTPAIIIHKIVLGDVGAGVCIRGVKFLGQISFHPSIGLIEFNDVQKEVFGGKEDLKPEEMVACIIHAIAAHVFNSVVHEIPHQLAKAASSMANAAVDGVKDSMGKAFKKIPCQS